MNKFVWHAFCILRSPMVGSWISLDDSLKFSFFHVREKANNISLRFLWILFCCELVRWNKILDKRRTKISIRKQESEISQETEIRQDRENKFGAKHFCFVSSSDLMAEARQTKWRTICEIINKIITYLVSFSQKSRTICLRSKSFENMRSQQYLCNQWLFSNSN